MRPVILIGGGAKNAERFLNLGIPVLTTWQAVDFVDNTHPNYFGRPGIWGQRLANKVLAGSDVVFNEGSRLSVWTVGYTDEIRNKVIQGVPDRAVGNPAWLDQCQRWRSQYPLVESPTHDDPPNGIHPYRFVQALEKHFADDEVIVTDMGTALTAAYQVLRLRRSQRLMTSGGLGEMGCALPAAIGASFARDKGPVTCLTCDGGIMLNLQELATIAHHKLPIRVIVFENQGYAMIRQTQRTAGYDFAGVSPETGVSFPNFRALAHAWGFAACDVWTWADFDKAMDTLFAVQTPAVVVYHYPPETDLLPKLLPGNKGFADMSP